MSKTKEPALYGIGAEFNSAKDVYEAAQKIRDLGFIRWDVHTPFPVHGMDQAMGLKRSRVSLISLLGGITGSLTALTLIFLTSADYRHLIPDWFPVTLIPSYPLIVHGKPFFAFEPSFPIFFELTILLTAFGTVLGLLCFGAIPRLNHPVFNWERFSRVTDDKFFIVIEATDPKFDEVKTRELLHELGGSQISLIRHDA
jgi:hypothetical protein